MLESKSGTQADAGTIEVKVTATDQTGKSVSNEFAITVRGQPGTPDVVREPSNRTQRGEVLAQSGQLAP